MEIFTLQNDAGMTARITSYGGIIMSLLVPDRHGKLDDVVLGYDAVEEYRDDRQYFGAIAGRYANRIAHARFTLDGREYRLTANDGPNHLHGGLRGFSRVVWDAQPSGGGGGDALALRYVSRDGEEGYPGTLDARVTYRVTERNALVVEYRATTDRPTPVNLTQHSYFNLAGRDAGSVRHHRLQINAEAYLPVDHSRIPTGGTAPVAGTRFDLRAGAPVTPDFDHTFVLPTGGATPVLAAHVEEPASGRTLDVVTTEPGVHLYTGNPAGLCLETQHFPDSPNRPEFPAAILRPGSVFASRTAFAFGCLAPTPHGRGS